MLKERFAWLPTRVWYMMERDYRYKTLWLRWYWDDNVGEEDAPSGFCGLSDDPHEDTRLWSRHKTKTHTNRW